MSTIEPQQNFSSSLIAVNNKQSSLSSITEQVTGGLLTLGQGFSDLFLNAQSLDPNSNTVLTNKKNSDEVDVSSSSFLSSLGFSFFEASSMGAIDELSPQGTSFSLEAMQNNLLSALQSSVFNANKITDEANIAPNTKSPVSTTFDVAQQIPTPEISLLNNIAQYSFGDNGLNLNDGFDSLNVLQHIPVLSSIYQDSSGQEISAMARLTGGYLYGGVVGLAFTALDLAFEGYTGETISESIVNFNYNELFSADTSPVDKSSAENENPYVNIYRDEVVYQNKTISK